MRMSMGGPLFVAVTAWVATGVPAKADDDQPSGAAEKELVSLVLTAATSDGCGPAKLDFVRVMPDGSADEKGYRIPEGRSLTVTEVDWLYSGGNPGFTEVLVISVENLDDPGKRHVAFQSTARLGLDGTGGANEQLPSGFLVSSKARMCVNVVPGPIGPPYRLSSLLVRGYLTVAR